MPIGTAINKPNEASRIQSERMRTRNEKTIRVEVVMNGFILTKVSDGSTAICADEDSLIATMLDFVREAKGK